MLEPLVVVYFAKKLPLVRFTAERIAEMKREHPGMEFQPGVGIERGPGAIVPESFVSKFDEAEAAVYMKGEWSLDATPSQLALNFAAHGMGMRVVIPVDLVESVRIIYTDGASSEGTTG